MLTGLTSAWTVDPKSENEEVVACGFCQLFPFCCEELLLLSHAGCCCCDCEGCCVDCQFCQFGCSLDQACCCCCSGSGFGGSELAAPCQFDGQPLPTGFCVVGNADGLSFALGMAYCAGIGRRPLPEIACFGFAKSGSCVKAVLVLVGAKLYCCLRALASALSILGCLLPDSSISGNGNRPVPASGVF